MENQSYRDFKNIRAYRDELYRLRERSFKTVDDVHKEKQLERELLDECKRYFDKYERDKKTLPIIYKADPKHKNGKDDVISNYDAEVLLNGFPDLQADLKEYIRKPSAPVPLPIEEQPSTEGKLKSQCVFKKIERIGKKPIWKIVFNGQQFPESEDIGLEYLHYYVKHTPKEFMNFTVFEAVNAKNLMPSDTKRLTIDVKSKDEEETSGYQIGGQGSIESRQEIGDYRTIKDINKRLKELPGEIEKAKNEGNLYERGNLEKEHEELLDQLSEYQHNGKLKEFADSKNRINETVRKAMNRALDKFKTIPGGEAIYNHFSESFKPTYSSHKSKGYKPLKPIPWILE